MRITKKYLSMARTVTILTLLLIATPSINSADSSLQQEVSIQNTADILVQDSFAETIFFEYGAESGVLQPPWEHAGPSGSGDKAQAGIEISTSKKRTGNYSMRYYQPAPPKSDAQRRVGARYWSHTRNEFYASWWSYFPTGYDDVVGSVSWFTHGGLKLYWGNPNDDGGKWSKGLRLAFSLGKDATGFYARATWSVNDRTGDWIEFWYDGNKEYLTLNRWHHFQLYIKVGVNDGIVTGWINDNLSLNRTNEHTDSTYWGEPEMGDEWAYNQYYPLDLEQYGPTSTPQLEIWVDDVVLATEKVSETYGVND